MSERHLTISTLRQPRTSHLARGSKPDLLVPYLRMRGRWLEDLGFSCGGRVRVVARRGRLVIEPLEVAGHA